MKLWKNNKKCCPKCKSSWFNIVCDYQMDEHDEVLVITKLPYKLQCVGCGKKYNDPNELVWENEEEEETND